MKRLLQVCFMAAMVFGLASCEKEGLKGSGSGVSGNSGSGGNGTTTTSLVGTSWQWYNGVVTFTDATNVTIATYQYGTYNGSYTYSNGSGVINVNIQGTPFTIPFTVSGSTMTAQNTPDGNITLTQVGGNNPNPNPNPNPGGGLTSLAGTAWQYSASGWSVTLYFTTANTGYSLEYDDGETYRDNFTYTYSNGSGVIYFEDDKKEDGSFTVSGNTLYIFGMAFTRVQ